MRQLAFGELELAVLRIVRERGRATVHEVHDRSGKKRSYTTIMTVMTRLAEKGELLREKEGRQYIYWLAPRNQSSFKGFLKRIQERVFGGRRAAMVNYLLEVDDEISDRELREMENMIRKKRLEKKKDG